MRLLHQFRQKVATWPYPVVTILAAVSAFGAYTSMYAFRKSFSAGFYGEHEYMGIDYKVWLVVVQLIGYTLSKFYGIRFIAEVTARKRAFYVLLLIGIAWLALFCFAVVPAPWNIVFLLINGFPLGMIWGLIFGYLEGRKSTEFMAAVMSVSLIFASGFVKTVGRTLVTNFGVNEFFMPFLTGALFVIPLLLFVCYLEVMPPPSKEDRQMRAERIPMNAAQRTQFFLRFIPGIILIIIIYVMLTVMRDVRDNFEVEIWADLGVKGNSIFTHVDTIISIIILAMMGLLILVKNNLQAFKYIHLFIFLGFMAIGVSTWMFDRQLIDPVLWMTFTGIGLYMGYVPFNAIFFERMIATFKYKSNVGFVMYVADSVGYLGTISIMMFKEFGHQDISWSSFFKDGMIYVAIIGGVGTLLSLIYFVQSEQNSKMTYKYKTI
ncbi:DUF5690 family protein [Pedobacter sp. AW31-3R]|uniref:DUF5690 family protein n=1 Tax=Pedobacter sp. AW31-3R TaxID=3445781 RepID=UPI003FA0C6BA